MFDGELVEGQQGFFVLGYLRHGLRPLGRKLIGERLDGAYDVRPVPSLGDSPDRSLRPPIDVLRQGTEYFRGFMDPISLMSGLRENVPHRRPEAECSVSDDQYRRAHTAPLERSRNSSPHDSVDSPWPSVKATSYFVPSSLAPTITMQYSLSSEPSLTPECTPSTQT